MRKLAFTPVLFALILSPACAEDSTWIGAWTGTWKFDPAKSHLTGETIRFSRSADGKFHFSDDSTFTDDFDLDGQEHRSAFDRSTNWKAVGDRAWDSETKMGGKVLTVRHYELSSDGGILSLTTSGTRPDGSEFRNQTEFARVAAAGDSAGKGLVGRWRSTKLDVSSPDVVVLSSPAPGVLRWELVADKQTAEGKVDGKPHLVSGPNVTKGLTLSFRRESATELSYVFRIDGKPETYGMQTLAADGHSFSDAYWHPGKKREKVTEVYVKQ
jgi:hypothetical protein